MAESPLVSILVVTYNQESFIKETLLSCVNQTYQNIEIIVSDDCSTDGTPQIIQEFSQKHPQIKFVQPQENLQITGNCNYGLSFCSGTYLALLGGDDLMLSEKIFDQVEFMESDIACNICYHNLDVFDSETDKTIRLFNKKKSKIDGDVRTVIKLGTFCGSSSVMIRTSCVPTNGFNDSIPLASDWIFYVECLANGGSIKYIDKILGRYRRHPKNITQLRRQDCLCDHLNSCVIIIQKYPIFTYEALSRVRSLIPTMRYFDNFDYSSLLKIGISFLSKKCLILWLIYKVSMHRIKL